MDSDDRSYNRTALAGTHRAVSSPPAKGKMSQLPDLSKIPPRVEPVKWNRRDALLYALGVGESNLNFVYELSPEFSILPTYPCVLRHKGDSFDIIDFFQRVNLTKVVVPGVKDAVGVHGEQLFEILTDEPLPVDSGDDYEMKTSVTGLFDAGKGTVQQLQYELRNKRSNKTVARWISTQFQIGNGGWGGPKRPKDEVAERWKVPKKNPDKVTEDQTTPEQALIYRLSGDTNPLHISPEYAKRQFPAPILHGLCTFGFCSRAILHGYCNSDPKKFKLINCRFSSPVYPGDKLRTEMWDMGETVVDGQRRRVITFEVKVPAKNLTVINSGFAYVAV